MSGKREDVSARAGDLASFARVVGGPDGLKLCIYPENETTERALEEMTRADLARVLEAALGEIQRCQ